MREKNINDMPAPWEQESDTSNGTSNPEQTTQYTQPQENPQPTTRRVRGVTTRRTGHGALHTFTYKEDSGTKIAELGNTYIKTLDNTFSVDCISGAVHVFPDAETTQAYFKLTTPESRLEFKRHNGFANTLEYAVLLITKRYQGVAVTIPIQLHGNSLKSRPPFITGEAWNRNIEMERQRRASIGDQRPVMNLSDNDLPHQTVNTHLKVIVSTYLGEKELTDYIYVEPISGIPSYVTDGLSVKDMTTLPDNIIVPMHLAIDAINTKMIQVLDGEFGQALISYKDVSLVGGFDSQTTVEDNIFGQSVTRDGRVIVTETSHKGNAIQVEYNMGSTETNKFMIVGDLLAMPSLVETVIDNEKVTRVRPDVMLHNIRAAEGASGTDVLLMIYMTIHALQSQQKVISVHGGKQAMGPRDVGIFNQWCKLATEDGEIIDIKANDPSLSKQDVTMLLDLLFSYPQGIRFDPKLGQYINMPKEFILPSIVLGIRESDPTTHIMSSWIKLAHTDINKKEEGASEIMAYMESLAYTGDETPSNVFNLKADEIINGHVVIHPVGTATDNNGVTVDLTAVNVLNILNVQGMQQLANEWTNSELLGQPDMMDTKMRILNTLYPNNVTVYDRLIEIHLHPKFITLLNTSILKVISEHKLDVRTPQVEQIIDVNNYGFGNLPPSLGMSMPTVTAPVTGYGQQANGYGQQGVYGTPNTGGYFHYR